MKKFVFALSALLLAACSSNPALPQRAFSGNPTPQLNPQLSRQLNRLSAPQNATSARTGFPIALAELSKVDPAAQLYEIDVWQEAAGKNLQYGFLRSDHSGKTFRVTLDVDSQQVSAEHGFKGAAEPVQVPYWKLDSAEIYARAQENGLRDIYYLATLWEDTWHISGLKQDLYFQMDAQTGEIKLRCTGPYNNNCALGDGTPVAATASQGMQQHLAKRQTRR